MGYKPNRKIYKLIFADDDMAGLEVRIRGLSIGGLLELSSLAYLAGHTSITPADLPAVEKLFGLCARALVEWNVVDDDEQPVPATLAGLYSQDQEFVLRIIAAWTEAIGSVPDPLPPSSDDGERGELAASIPMETLPLSLVP